MSPMPAVVPGTAGSKQVTAGHRFTCAVDASDRAICWGMNAFSQLGSTGADNATPTPVAGLGTVTRVRGGGSFTCAMEVGGAVRCWGKNNSEQTGNPDTSMLFAAPQPAIVSDASDAQLEGASGCAIRQDGTLACWGGDGGGLECPTECTLGRL